MNFENEVRTAYNRMHSYAIRDSRVYVNHN